jgi:hypothetical protein
MLRSAMMPRKRDDAIRMEGIGVVAVTARATEVLATDVPESSFKLSTVIGRILAHESGREDEFVAEWRRDRAAGFQQGPPSAPWRPVESGAALRLGPVRKHGSRAKDWIWRSTHRFHPAVAAPSSVEQSSGKG